jgi:SAM-dependent methyltransferase
VNIGNPVERPVREVSGLILKLSGRARDPRVKSFGYISVLYNTAQMEQRLTVRNTALVTFVLGPLMLGALALSLRYRHTYGRCSVCGRWGLFRRQHSSIREGYQCSHCAASLRYRHQASVIVAKYATQRSKSFAELAREPSFLGLSIYEPGIIGPFRRYLEAHPNYTTSYLWEGVEPGESHRGVRCENLESLTFANETFDLVISSDIFEHVRKPYLAFAEVHRVLKPGGRHIFTVPLSWPLKQRTVPRVDTTEDEDVSLLPEVYHGSPTDPKGSLVYTDFGLDIVEDLERIGFRTEVHQAMKYNLTFCAEKQ